MCLDRAKLELYSDYLISSFSYVTATGLSNMLDNAVSHDSITRFLSKEEYTSKDLWGLVKSTVRAIETTDGVIIFDDTVKEKKYTDENEMITWHYDHSEGRTVKGVNILSCIYSNEEASIPVAFEIIKKEILYTELKTKKKKRRSLKTKNGYFREMIEVCNGNSILYIYVLADNWFSSKENMIFVKEKGKEFIFALKSNRMVALSLEDKKKGKFKAVSLLDLEKNTVYKVYIKGIEFPISLTMQVFKNKDGSSGVLYLVSSDLSLDYHKISTIYQKRWKIEEYHKSISVNTGLTKSPTKIALTQSNHFFASIYAYFKLEMLSIKCKLNHFALRTKLYIKALKISFEELQNFKSQTLYA